jgi:hypothetical protein
MLGGIRRAFGVEFYEVGGRPYFFVPTWEKHQKIDKRSGAKHPAPEEGTPYNPDPDDTSYQQEHADSADTRRIPPSARGSSGAGTEEQRNRGTEEGKDFPSPASPPRDCEPAGISGFVDDDPGAIPGLPPVPVSARQPEPGSDDDPDWVKFWEIYPNKVSKADARKAWAKAVKKVAPFVIIAGAERYRELVTLQRREKGHIKDPRGWLNGERWTDEITLPSQRPENGNNPGRSPRANVHHEHGAGAEIAKGLTS